MEEKAAATAGDSRIGIPVPPKAPTVMTRVVRLAGSPAAGRKMPAATVTVCLTEPTTVRPGPTVNTKELESPERVHEALVKLSWKVEESEMRSEFGNNRPESDPPVKPARGCVQLVFVSASRKTAFRSQQSNLTGQCKCNNGATR